MGKWEYLYVELAVTSTPLIGRGDEPRPRYVNGRETKGWKEITIYDYSNQLGQQGWELVGTAFSPSNILVFKRLLP